MNLLHEKIDILCEKLQLLGISHNYLKISDEAAQEESTFTSFLEKILTAEWKMRQTRRQTALTQFAGFPTVKTLDDFDCQATA